MEVQDESCGDGGVGMLFCTYKFLFLFLPVTVFGYYGLLKVNRFGLEKVWLIAASLFFYAQGSISFFPFFTGGIVVNYVAGTLLSRWKTGDFLRKAALALVVLANVALLGYYKYMDFFIDNVNLVCGTEYKHWNLALPIGISFFTFQQIAFLVDSYRRETEEYNFMNYALFVTFFPQLIVGPIVHHKEIIPQFENPDNRKMNYDNISRGLMIFAIGCAKKILLSDPLTTDAQQFFGSISDGIIFTDAWYYSIAYTISYYFDLSGYADMAIGLGKIFNIEIPQNFNSPYKALNFQEYWRRWHMTLSRFLSSYIFRGVYKRGSRVRNYYTATMATFLVSGFWHGAGWTFVLWGIVNGMFVCISAWRARKGRKMHPAPAFVLTALGVVGTRILFVSNTFQDAWMVYKGLFNFSSVAGTGVDKVISCGLQALSYFMEQGFHGFMLLFAMGICWFAPNTRRIMEKHENNIQSLVYAAGLVFLCILNMSKTVPFLYFQF